MPIVLVIWKVLKVLFPLYRNLSTHQWNVNTAEVDHTAVQQCTATLKNTWGGAEYNHPSCNLYSVLGLVCLWLWKLLWDLWQPQVIKDQLFLRSNLKDTTSGGKLFILLPAFPTIYCIISPQKLLFKLMFLLYNIPVIVIVNAFLLPATFFTWKRVLLVLSFTGCVWFWLWLPSPPLYWGRSLLRLHCCLLRLPYSPSAGFPCSIRLLASWNKDLIDLHGKETVVKAKWKWSSSGIKAPGWTLTP